MKMKDPASERIFYAVNNIIMLLVMVVTVYPVLYVLLASLSDSSRLMAHSGLLWYPLGLNLEAYKEVFKQEMVYIGYGNTIFYVVMGTAVSLCVTMMGAYVLSRRVLVIKKYMMIMITITMFFSGGLVPLYLLIKNIGLYDTRWALILPVAINTWNLIVMRTSFASIPAELEEAAKIDGADDFTILFRIIVPVSLPIIAVIVLFYGVSYWNAWFQGAIFLQNRALYPLQLYLREILIYSDVDSMMTGSAGISADRASIGESIKYATIIVSTLPILCVYPFLQKYFVKGIMVGSIKG